MRRAKLVAAVASGAGAVGLLAAGLTAGVSSAPVAASASHTQAPATSGFDAQLTAAAPCKTYSPASRDFLTLSGNGVSLNLLGEYVLALNTSVTITGGCFLPGSTVTLTQSGLLVGGNANLGTATVASNGTFTKVVGGNTSVAQLLTTLTATGTSDTRHPGFRSVSVGILAGVLTP